MHEAVKTAVQLQSERLRDEAQAENADFLNKLDDNIKKIIKDQVKEQVKAQVSKIFPKIKRSNSDDIDEADDLQFIVHGISTIRNQAIPEVVLDSDQDKSQDKSTADKQDSLTE
ncbi:hypothetical protein Tco_1509395 [Tanacetum coccineum]